MPKSRGGCSSVVSMGYASNTWVRMLPYPHSHTRTVRIISMVVGLVVGGQLYQLGMRRIPRSVCVESGAWRPAAAAPSAGLRGGRWV
jgi:hypothetical protein